MLQASGISLTWLVHDTSANQTFTQLMETRSKKGQRQYPRSLPVWEHKATGRVSLLLKIQDTACFALEFKTTAATLDVDFYLTWNCSKEKISRTGATAIAVDRR